HIVSSFLKSKGTPINFLKKLQQQRHDYNGFNLIAGTVNELYFYSKQDNVIQPIEPGTYSVSNASLNTPWPKVVKARTRLESYLFKNDTVDPQILFKQLSDDTLAEDNELPDTGVGQTIEKQLSSVFIRTEGYGTKSSTVLLVTHDDELTFMQRTFKKGIYSEDLVQKHIKLSCNITMHVVHIIISVLPAFLMHVLRFIFVLTCTITLVFPNTAIPMSPSV